jgi:hypothetical protein
MKRFLTGVIFLFSNLFATSQSYADLLPANGADSAKNFAEISLLEDRLRVALEIDFEDFPIFVSAPAQGVDPAAFLSKRVGKTLIVDADGISISPVIRSVEIADRKQRAEAYRPTNVSRQKLLNSSQVIYAVLDYRFEGRPEQLTLTPPLETGGMPAATLGFLADHAGVPITDYRYLSQPEVLRPNWEDPWYTAFDNPNLTRHHKSALLSFMQIRPRQIQHEIIFRLRDLETWTDLDLGDVVSLDGEAMAKVKQQAAEVFAANNPVSSDGILLVPADVRVNQLSVGVSGLNVLENPLSTDRASALLGIVLTYPQSELPQKVEMTWTLFTEEAQSIPVQVSDPAGGLPNRVTVNEPTLSWSNYLVKWTNPAVYSVTTAMNELLAVPYLSILLLVLSAGSIVAAMRKRAPQLFSAVAASALTAAIFLRPMTVDIPIPITGSPEPEFAQIIMDGLLENINVAMLEPNVELLDTALAPFVLQSKIPDVSSEIRRGFSVTLPSGALAQTDAIENIEIQGISSTEPKGGSSILASWTALVSGGHWGHQHQRAVEYRALFDVSQKGGVWYLDGLTVLESKSPEPTPSIPKNS